MARCAYAPTCSAILAALCMSAAGIAAEAIGPAPAAVVSSDSSIATTPEAVLDDLLKRMDARAAEIKTIEADITITTTENFSGRQSPTRSGRIYVRKPDELMLDIESPYPRKIWISRDFIVDYRPDLNTGDRVKLDPAAGKPQAIGISTTAAELRESFDLTLATPNEKPKEYVLILTPKANVKTDFTTAEVMIDAAKLLPITIVQKNADLDETKTFTFERTRVNPRLSDSVFAPKFSAGADIAEHGCADWKGP